LDIPFQAVEDGGEGVSEDVIIMDEGTIGATRAVGDPPAKVLGGAGEDLADTTAILEADFVGRVWINEPTGFNDGEEAPADLGFFLGGEFNGDHQSRECMIEQRPEAFAHAGGVDDNVLRRPLLRKVLYIAEDGEVVFAGPGMTGEDAVGGMVKGFEGGEVDADDGEGGGVTARVAKPFTEEGGGKASIGFVHSGDVEEEGAWGRRNKKGGIGSGAPRTHVRGVALSRKDTGTVCSLRLRARREHQRQSPSVEHAGLGVDGFTEVLGTDERMIAAAFGNDTVHMGAIGRDQTADIIGGEEEDPLDAIHLLSLEGKTTLAFKEGTGSPGGAPEDTSGIGRGGHGIEVLVEFGRIDLLGFVDREEKVSSGTHNFGVRLAGKELQAGAAKRVHIALGSMPATARADTFVEGMADASHVVGGLRFEGGGNGDDKPARVSITEEKPGKEMRLKLVLAGLPREDDNKGEAKMVKNGFLDGKNDPALIGTEVDTARPGPADRITTDGGADTKSEERAGLMIICGHCKEQ